MGVRSAVRATGPIPLSKLTPLLPDEFLEVLSQKGIGLAAFIERYPSFLVNVHLPGHIIVTIPQELLAEFRTMQRKQMATWVISLLSAAHFLPNQPQVVAMGLSCPHPTTEELSKALRRWTLISVDRLEGFLQSSSGLFAFVKHSRRVRLLVLNNITPSEAAMQSVRGGLAPRLKAAKTQESSRFEVWLRTVVPSQFHVPVSYVMDTAKLLGATEAIFGSKTPSLELIKGQFQQVSASVVDIRAFGDALHTVFVRVINPEPLLLEGGVPSFRLDTDTPELKAHHHNPTALALELTASIEQYAAQSSLTRARIAKGLQMARLRDYVPATLMRKLEAFYGFSEHDDPSVCILLLDRVRHMWEVQLSEGTARPWSFLPESELPSSLTLQTSPSPRVLLHTQRLLLECGGQPLIDLYNVLPADLKTAFMELYASPARVPTTNGAAAEAPPPDEAQIMQALQAFVRTHSLFFFTKDNWIFTSRSPRDSEKNVSPLLKKEREVNLSRRAAAMMTSARKPGSPGVNPVPLGGAKLTDAEIAKAVYDALPEDDWILADALRNYLYTSRRFTSSHGSRDLSVQTFRREFFERHHNMFTIHTMFGFDKLVVSRRNFKVRAPNMLCPRIDTIRRVIKMMALLSVDSISDGSLTRRLPQEGRTLVKTLGTVTDIAEALPMWFVVHRDEINFGSSLIRYIGPLAETPPSPFALKPPPSGVLTRKVPNDPFAEIATETNVTGDSVDGWNEDWNEEDGLPCHASVGDDVDGK
jgi:hypothetical protein